MKVLCKRIILGLMAALPVAVFASGLNLDGPPMTGIEFNTYVTANDSNKVEQELDSVSKYISDMSDDILMIAPYVPRIYLAGYAGTQFVGQADLLFPMQLIDDRTFVIYAQGRYSPGKNISWQYETWTGSAGLLYRRLSTSFDSILGAYILGDYNKAPSGHKYLVIGPGLESLGRNWDFHLNGYLPMGDKQWKNEAWIHQFGDLLYCEFIEGTNNVYSRGVSTNEETGIGGDFAVGRKLFKVYDIPIKGYVQGYYYNLKYNSNVLGGGLKITAQPTRYITFSANDTYDNYQHNVFMLGAQIRINDLFNRSNPRLDENDLSSRLLDPVDRNYGSIGRASSPTRDSFSLDRSLSGVGVFFSDQGTGYVSANAAQYSKGTYGNPYTEESDVATRGMQSILDEIHTNFPGDVGMYFSPGSYQGSNGSLPINFYSGMSAYGRDYWYETPTSGSQRALFMGSISLLGNNVLDSIRVQNTGAFAAGLTASGVSDIILNNLEVGTQTNSGNYATGITMNAANLSIANSKIYSYQSGAAAATGEIEAIGIKMTNGGTLVISGSEVQGIANETGGGYDRTGDGYGIYADGKEETITINESYIVGQGQGGQDFSANGYGILVGASFSNISSTNSIVENNVLNISRSILLGKGNNTANSESYSNGGYGLLIGSNFVADAKSNLSTYLSIDNNMITVTDSNLRGSGLGVGCGLLVGSAVIGGGLSGDAYSNYLIYNNSINISSSSLNGSEYGLLVGYDNLGNYLNGSNNRLESFINKNTIAISSGSVLTGKSNSSVGASNGYGLLVGYGRVYILPDYNESSLEVNSSVYGNNIAISSSSLVGTGLQGDDENLSGSGYGLMVGHRYVKVDTPYTITGLLNMNTYGNNVSISGSSLEASGTSSVSGNAYGLLMGSVTIDSSTGTTINNIWTNKVIFDGSTVIANLLGTSGNAWGINVGENGDSAGSLTNELDISNSVITLNANALTAYGIWMLNGSGTLSISGNTVTRDSGAITGCNIYYNGVCTVWS
jgi:trimeric autotransporter adhesin